MSEESQDSRLRHELERRHLEVARVESLSPGMSRVVLSGGDLAGFMSLGFDDLVALLSGEPGRAARTRESMSRTAGTSKGELWIDFFLRATGPAAIWARRVVSEPR